MSDWVPLTEKGKSNKKVLSVAFDLKREIRRLRNRLDNKRAESDCFSPIFYDMPKSYNHERILKPQCILELEESIEEKVKEQLMEADRIEKIISGLFLPDYDKKLLRLCYVDLYNMETAFEKIHYSHSSGYRKLNALLNSIDF